MDWALDIVLEIAREKGYAPKIVALYSEQSRDTIKARLAAGKVHPLPPLGALAPDLHSGQQYVYLLDVQMR